MSKNMVLVNISMGVGEGDDFYLKHSNLRCLLDTKVKTVKCPGEMSGLRLFTSH